MRCHTSNGIPVDVFPHEGLASATWSVWVDGGSRDEDSSELGVTHLLERVLSSSHGGRTRARVLTAGLGGEANGLASKEHLVLFATAPSAEIEPLALQIIDDLVLPPITEKVVDHERGIARVNLCAAASDPLTQLHDRWNAEALGFDPLARPTGGTLSDLEWLDVTTIAHAHERRVHAGNVRVLALGDVTSEAALAIAEVSELTRLPDGEWYPGDGAPSLGAERWLGGGDPEIGCDIAVTLLGGVGPGMSEPDELAAAVVADAVLGGSAASLVVRRLCDELAVAYECRSTYTAFRDLGLWRTMVLSEPGCVAVVCDVIRAVIGQALETLAATDVARGRQAAIGRCLLRRDSWLDRMLWTGSATGAGWQGDVEESFIQRLRDVGSDAVAASMQRLFDVGVIFAAAGDVADTQVRGHLELG